MRLRATKLLLLCVLSASFVGIETAKTKVSDKPGGDIDITELQNNIDSAVKGTIFEFGNDDTLPERIVVNVTGLVFSGNVRQRPVLKCAPEKGGFLVTYCFLSKIWTRIVCRKDATFENLVIRGCERTAIEIHHEGVSSNPFDPQPEIDDIEPIYVVFRNVDFVNNEGTFELQSSGAILAKEKSTVEIEKCRFENNTATSGGAILFSGRSLSIQSSSFVNNSAENSGGAVYGSLDRQYDSKGSVGSKIQIQDCKFESNKALFAKIDTQGLTILNNIQLESHRYFEFDLPAESGGAIYLESYETVEIFSNLFKKNTAVSAGGAIYFSDNDNITITSCIFDSNAALPDQSLPNSVDLQLGGAIFAAFTEFETQMFITSCSFKNNSATYGGALHLVSPSSTKLELMGSNFTENVGSLGGGAIVFRNIESPFMRSCLFRNNSAFSGGAIFVTNGGGINIEVSVKLQRPTAFEDNTALDGGAIFAMGAGSVVIQRAFFERNRANKNGGGIYITDSRAGGTFSYNDARMYNNSAYSGGGIYMETLYDFSMSLGGSDENRDGRLNEFFENKAVAGGAIYYRASNLVRNRFFLNDGQFSKNAALFDKEEVFNEPLRNSNRHLSRSMLLSGEEKENEATKLELRNTEACEPGGAGAICLILSSMSPRAPASIEILNSNFSQNEAVAGGAIVVSTDDDVQWKATCNNTDSTADLLTANPCQKFYFRRPLFVNNKAQFAGGAILATHLPHLHFSNDDSLNFKSVDKLNLETNFKRNKIGIGGYGKDIAGTAVRLNILNPKIDVSLGILIDNQPSGSSNFLPKIEIELIDGLNQRVTAGVVDSTFSVDVDSIHPENGSSIASGQVVSEAINGVATFEALALSAESGIYELVFSVDSNAVRPVQGSVFLRDCILGERYNSIGFVCESCPFETFTIYKDVPKCETCPDYARCAGNASWVPIDGYWHSSPLSVIMIQCLNEEACSYTNRTQILENKRDANLEAFLERFEETENPDFTNEEYPQCKNGYDGPLCGSCEHGYGQVNGNSCVRCTSRILAAFVVIFLAIWQLVFVGFTIRSAIVMIYDKKRLEIFDKLPNHKNTHLRLTEIQTNAESSDRNRLDQNQEMQPSPAPDTDQAAPRDIYKLRRMSFDLREFDDIDKNMDLPAKTKAAFESIRCAERLSETIKIVINFFQITSIAVDINLEWKKVTKWLLTSMNSVSGVSNSAAFMPVTCLIQPDSHLRSIYGIVFQLFFPFILLFIVIVFFTVYFVCRAKYQNENNPADLYFQLTRHVIISVLVFVFFSYQSVSKNIMTIFSCVRLDREEHEIGNDFDHPENEVSYSQYSTAESAYWTEDTGIECLSRPHTLLIGFLGVPGFFMFVIGVPIALVIFLFIKYSRKELTKHYVLSTYGFIYRQYKDECVFWEVMILTRKVLIGVILVYAYPLGPNLQGILSLGVVIGSLILHLIHMPYKYPALNVLEGCSLSVSMFTFYFGILFEAEKTKTWAKLFLSVILVIAILSLVIAFMIKVCFFLNSYLKEELAFCDVPHVPKNFVGRIFVYLSYNTPHFVKNFLTKTKDFISSSHPSERTRDVESNTTQNVDPSSSITQMAVLTPDRFDSLSFQETNE